MSISTVLVLALPCLGFPVAGPPVAEQWKLVASDAAPGQAFGTAVDVSGDVVLVGAYGDAASGLLSGAAYLFDASDGTQSAKLVPSDGAAGDRFGRSVALDGTLALVGAFLHGGTGAAYLFDTALGAELHELVASDGAADDWFGAAVALDGTRALVGASQDDDGGDRSGAAYVFDTTSGLELLKLLPDDGGAGHRFGHAVAIGGNLALVGAPEDAVGSAYALDATTGAQLAKLQPADLGPGAFFGAAVAANGALAIVGAPFDDASGLDSGSAYVFSIPGGTQLAKLVPADGAAGDELGTSVALFGNLALVGARRDGDNGPLSGAAYVFDATTGLELAKLLASDGAALDELGISVALDGTRAVAGAWMDDASGPFSGSAYVFAVEPEASAPFCDATDGALASCPCGNAGAPDTGCEIQQGTGGVSLRALRQETAPANRVTWIGAGFPVSTAPTSIVIRATTLEPVPVVFGDGLRCAGLPLTRLAATFATGGTVVHTHGHGAMAGSGAFYYQLWFRNTPSMFCTPDAFNLSGGQALDW